MNKAISKTGYLFPSILFICIMMLDWNGYGYYVFYIPFLLLIPKGIFNYIDCNFKLFLAFGLSYSLIDIFNTGYIRYAYNILPVINFPIAYLMGKVIGKNKPYDEHLKILWLLAFSLAMLTIISIYISFIEEGFSTVARDIKLIGYENGSNSFLYTATGLYSKLLPLTLFIPFIFFKIDKKYKYLYFVSALLAFVCCLRLQSRSAIYIASISLIIPLIFGGQGNLKNKVCGILFIVITCYYVLNNFSDELLVIERFQNNNAFENAGQESRADLAKKTLIELSTKPFGGMIFERYAHNLWIDCARVSGWLPAFLLIIITWNFIKSTIFIYKENYINKSYRIFIVVLSVCLLTYFNTEPIIEGASMLFTFFCIYFGIVQSHCNSIKYRYLK